jgi:hypothetical protein
MADYSYRDSEYTKLLHAMQSGVKSLMEVEDNKDTGETSPKHLRTGVNSALITSSALVKTLVDKGLITFEEFRDNEIELLQKDVKSYENKLSQHYGVDVKLL